VESSRFNEADGMLSPDNKWLAFVSDESGRPEVYIRPFGHAGEKIRVSIDGGSEPRWHPKGRELFYVSSDGMLMSVPVTMGQRTHVSRPVPLFRITSAGSSKNSGCAITMWPRMESVC